MCWPNYRGYFADIGEKEVDGLAELGFPYASIDRDGTGIIMKTPIQVEL